MGILIVAQPLEPRVAQFPGGSPLAESDFADQLGLDPVHPRHRARHCARVKRGASPLDRGQAVMQATQHLVGESGADLARVNQPSAAVVVTEQQRTEPDP